MTRNALIAYSIGLLGMILVKVLAPGFYARQNVRTPVKIGIFTLCVTQALNLALIGWLQHAGLALAIGLAACLNALLLYRGLRRHGIYTPQAGWRSFCGRLLIALTVMGGVLWFVSGTATDWLHWGLTERLWRLMLIVISGASTYFAALALTGFRLRDFKRKAAT